MTRPYFVSGQNAAKLSTYSIFFIETGLALSVWGDLSAARRIVYDGEGDPPAARQTFYDKEFQYLFQPGTIFHKTQPFHVQPLCFRTNGTGDRNKEKSR